MTPYPDSHAQSSSSTITPSFIDNDFFTSAATTYFDVHDPATNVLVTRVPQSTDAELHAAVTSAESAFPAWRATSLLKRQQMMFEFVGLIKSNRDRLAHIITLEQGKTIADAKGDVLRGLQVAETACGITTQLTGDVMDVGSNMETRTYREPLGVVAAICPFNFPVMIPLWSLAPALITGNCIVIKPSERVSGAVMVLAELLHEAGFPPGVFNVVHGGSQTVDFILDSPVIKAVSFVGSNRVGQYIYTLASASGKRVQANLGAKNHAVVLPDCDKALALRSLIAGAFGAAGQRCMALSVAVMVGTAETWLPELVEQCKKLNCNGGFEVDADFGPVISPQSKARTGSLIQSAIDEGATVLLDGRNFKPSKYPNGNWVGATIIANVTPQMKCYTEEIFGPVLVCTSSESLDSAIMLVNQNQYGNGAALFTSSGAAATHFRHSIEAGQIGINVPIPVPIATGFSFSGNKSSVAGGGGSLFYGKSALNFYTQNKTITSFWNVEESRVHKANLSMMAHL